jgi:hypothetical protein
MIIPFGSLLESQNGMVRSGGTQYGNQVHLNCGAY